MRKDKKVDFNFSYEEFKLLRSDLGKIFSHFRDCGLENEGGAHAIRMILLELDNKEFIVRGRGNEATSKVYRAQW